MNDMNRDLMEQPQVEEKKVLQQVKKA